jgi:ferredoxin
MTGRVARSVPEQECRTGTCWSFSIHGQFTSQWGRTARADLYPVKETYLDWVLEKEEPMAAQRDVPQAVRPAAGNPLHVVVDLNRCQAYAQCCFLAPSVFALHGEEALWYDPAPDAAQREHVQRAAAACPVRAITVEGEAATRAASSKKAKETHAATQRS